MAELSLISMRYAEAARLNSAGARGETEAVEFFRDLWPEMGECFLCGNPLAPGAVSRRRGKPGAAMLGQQCDICSALPWQAYASTKVIQTHVCGLETDAPGLEGA